MPADQDATPRRIRLVVADDNDGARVLLRALLEAAEDIELVGEAVNGADAVDLAQDLEVDAVLLDINMPVMDGVRAAELLRTLRPSVRLLLHTSDPDGVAWHKARDLGFAVVAKLDFSETLAALRDAVSRPARASASSS